MTEKKNLTYKMQTNLKTAHTKIILQAIKRDNFGFMESIVNKQCKEMIVDETNLTNLLFH